MSSIEMTKGDNAVLLIHGLSSSPLEMMSCAKALYRAGFSVRVPHYSTFGFNTEDPETGVIEPWEKWREEIFNDFRQMKKKYNKVFVVGLCVGAVLTLDLAKEFKDEIAGLALLSTALFYDGWAMPWYKNLIPFIPYVSKSIQSYFCYHEKEPYGVKNEHTRSKIKMSMKKHKVSAAGSAKITNTGIYEAYLLTKNVRKNLEKISQPVLIVHSEEDETASVRNVDFLQRNIRSKHIDVLLLKDSYHMITLDNEKKLVAAEVTRFFNELCSNLVYGKIN